MTKLLIDSANIIDSIILKEKIITEIISSSKISEPKALIFQK